MIEFQYFCLFITGYVIAKFSCGFLEFIIDIIFPIKYIADRVKAVTWCTMLLIGIIGLAKDL